MPCFSNWQPGRKAGHPPACRSKALPDSLPCAYLLLIVLRNDRPVQHENEVISFGAPTTRGQNATPPAFLVTVPGCETWIVWDASWGGDQFSVSVIACGC